MTLGLKKIIPGVGRMYKVQADELEGNLILQTPGKTFYVHPDLGSDVHPGHDGQTWQHSFATVGAALDECVDGRGDVIVVMAGTYAENVVVNKDYVTMVGIFSGYGRPDITPAAGIAMDVQTAQGFTALRMRFASADSDVVRVEGNGFDFDDCVFDGAAGQAATECLVRLWTGDAADEDNYTGSEGKIKGCLFRSSNGKGLVIDCQSALIGVLPTDNIISDCRFVNNVGEDVFLAATAVSVADMKRFLFERCYFGMGTSKNKATHIDIQTNKIGALNGSVFVDCYINDDTVDATAIKHAGTGASFIGLHSLDAEIVTDTLD